MRFKAQFVLIFLSFLSATQILAADERQLWIENLIKVSNPILKNAAHDSLRIKMSVYATSNQDYQYLEALGRIVCGIAPWLELEDDTTAESALRETYRDYTLRSIKNAVNPQAKDYMNFSKGNQPLVDAAYLAQGLLRAPERLWGRLDEETKQRLIEEMKKTRCIKPGQNNWLLFASMVEAFLLEYDGEYKANRLQEGVRRFLHDYYKGDGIYGDGIHFAMDYYNSFVIHPMLTDIIRIGVRHGLKDFQTYENIQIPRLQRYAAIQERMISPEGTYPVIGRTLICRIGAFHALAETALLEALPKNLSSGQVRSAMTAVLKKQFKGGKDFDKDGFMTIGFNGTQTDFAENYVSSGSPYHCTTFFLPLGLSLDSEFWTSPAEKWTSLKAFTGEEFPPDHAYHESVRDIIFLEYIQLSASQKVLLYAGILLCGTLNILGLCYVYKFVRNKKLKMKTRQSMQEI